MARKLVNDELWEIVRPLFPPPPPHKTPVGRKQLDERRVFTGILFILQSGTITSENGMRLRHHVLAPRATGKRKGSGTICIAFYCQAAQRRPHRFLARDRRQFVGARCAWAKKRSQPPNRRKAGSKHHLLVDATGTPLNVILTGANRHNSTQFMPLLDGL